MDRSPTSEEQALKASTNTFPSGRGKSKGKWRDRRGRETKDDAKNTDNQKSSKGGDYDISQVECFRCRTFGHYASNCYTKLSKEENKEISLRSGKKRHSYDHKRR